MSGGDVLADAFRRGAELQEQLLAEAGGTWTAGHVARHLGISRQAVDERRRTNGLLAVETGDDYLYPCAQFTESGVLPGLAEVLQAIGSESGWTRLSVLLGETLIGPEQSVLEAVRAGDLAAALYAASAWGEQGAG
jgi:hypothetical protein